PSLRAKLPPPPGQNCPLKKYKRKKHKSKKDRTRLMSRPVVSCPHGKFIWNVLPPPPNAAFWHVSNASTAQNGLRHPFRSTLCSRTSRKSARRFDTSK